MNSDNLRVLVDTVTILSGERVVVVILGGEGVGAFVSVFSALCKAGQIELVIVVLDDSLLGSLAVMDGSLDLWLNN